MERLKDAGRAYPTACFTCAARVYLGGEYFCNPEKLDDRSIIKNVARYRAQKCPKDKEPIGSSMSAEITLRKLLRR